MLMQFFFYEMAEDSGFLPVLFILCFIYFCVFVARIL